MLEKINIFLFNSINRFANQNVFVDYFFIILAKYLFIVFILFLIYLWFVKKQRFIVLLTIYSSSIALFLNFIIRSFYKHNRPFMSNLGITLIQHSPSPSFPSNHTSFYLSIAIILSYFKHTRIYGILLLFLGILGGVSRVFCGIHFPFDILGSFVVALISSFLVIKLKKIKNI